MGFRPVRSHDGSVLIADAGPSGDAAIADARLTCRIIPYQAGIQNTMVTWARQLDFPLKVPTGGEGYWCIRERPPTSDHRHRYLLLGEARSALGQYGRRKAGV
jgi:hypothetical protein